MKVIEFPEQTSVIAKDQQPYTPIPVHHFDEPYGTIACCWHLSIWERIYVLFTGTIWHQVMTFNRPLQPQMLTVEKPSMSAGK